MDDDILIPTPATKIVGYLPAGIPVVMVFVSHAWQGSRDRTALLFLLATLYAGVVIAGLPRLWRGVPPRESQQAKRTWDKPVASGMSMKLLAGMAVLVLVSLAMSPPTQQANVAWFAAMFLSAVVFCDLAMRAMADRMSQVNTQLYAATQFTAFASIALVEWTRGHAGYAEVASTLSFMCGSVYCTPVRAGQIGGWAVSDNNPNLA